MAADQGDPIQEWFQQYLDYLRTCPRQEPVESEEWPLLAEQINALLDRPYA